MRIIAKSTIKKFQMQPGYRDAEGLLEGCYFAGTHTQYDRIDVELNVGWVQNTRLPYPSVAAKSQLRTMRSNFSITGEFF